MILLEKQIVVFIRMTFDDENSSLKMYVEQNDKILLNSYCLRSSYRRSKSIPPKCQIEFVSKNVLLNIFAAQIEIQKRKKSKSK